MRPASGFLVLEKLQKKFSQKKLKSLRWLKKPLICPKREKNPQEKEAAEKVAKQAKNTKKLFEEPTYELCTDKVYEENKIALLNDAEEAPDPEIF